MKAISIICNCYSYSGWLHVCPRRCRQHVREPEDWLFVQSVVGGAQPAGTDLGETAENVPSRKPAVHTSAAQPGTDTHTNPAAEIDKAPRAAVCDGTALTLKSQITRQNTSS